jgi:hypothetical protein
MSLSLGQGGWVFLFWNVQVGLRFTKGSMGLAEMSYQGSLRSYEPIILSEGFFVLGGIPWLASILENGENQGMRVMLV